MLIKNFFSHFTWLSQKNCGWWRKTTYIFKFSVKSTIRIRYFSSWDKKKVKFCWPVLSAGLPFTFCSTRYWYWDKLEVVVGQGIESCSRRRIGFIWLHEVKKYIYIMLIKRSTPTPKLPHRVGVIFFLRLISTLRGTYFHFLCGFCAGRTWRKLKNFEVILGVPRNSEVLNKSVHSLYHTVQILWFCTGFILRLSSLCRIRMFPRCIFVCVCVCVCACV
jgi:hypothetical protein